MRILPTATALGLGIALAAVIAACGSSTPASVTTTRSSSATPTSSSTTTVASHTSSHSSTTSSTTHLTPTRTTTTATTTTTTTTTRPTTSPTTTSSTTTATTRTETAPAFVQTNPNSSVAISHDLAAALAVLARSGYVAVRPLTYHAGDTLRVLIGARPGASTPTEHAFFFDQTIYLGTDARLPSAGITLLGQSDTEVTLGYAIHPRESSAPSSVRRVRFALDMGHLSAIDPLPSAAARG